MNLSNSRATIGLTTKATPTSTAVSGSVPIGYSPQTITIADADVAYAVRAFFASGNPELSINITTGGTGGSTPFVAGVAQVETATAAGTATASGNGTTTITSAGMTGSPLAITTAILINETPTTWAGKVRESLAANATIAARFVVSGTTTSIILTRKPGTVLVSDSETVNLFVATDATLNIALAGPAGVTAAATSANTVAGTVTSGVLIRDGDAEDFEGIMIPTCTTKAVLFTNSGANSLSALGIALDGNSSALITGGNVLAGESPLVITGSASILTVMVIAKAN